MSSCKPTQKEADDSPTRLDDNGHVRLKIEKGTRPVLSRLEGLQCTVKDPGWRVENKFFRTRI